MSDNGEDPGREFMGRLDGPVFIVTAAAGQQSAGCLAAFVTPCSMQPPRLLACLSTANHTYGIARHFEVLRVKFLMLLVYKF